MRLALPLMLLALPAAAAACEPGVATLRVADTGPAAGAAPAEAMRLLAERVGEALDGRLCLEATPWSAGDGRETVAALAAGRIDLAAVDASALGGLSPAFLLYDLPFLFDGIEDVLAFDAAPEGRALRSAGAAAGVTGLALWIDGFEQISADRPVRRPGDAAGLTFAAGLSEIERAYFTALEAAWIDFTRPEVYHALRDRVIEGQNSSWVTMSEWNLHRVQAHAVETNHSVAAFVLVAARDAWEGLDPALRTGLERVVAEVTHERNRLVFERGEAAKARLVAGGMAVHELSGEERAAWRAAMRPVWAEFEAAIGPALVAAAAGR